MSASSPPKRPYRSKTIKPCDACRRRRTACIREASDGICSLCRMRGQSCSFDSTPRRRKTRQEHKQEVVSTDSTVSHDLEPLDPSVLPNKEQAIDAPASPALFPESPQPAIDVVGDHTSLEINSTRGSWFNGTTLMRDRTCLYAGGSSDQDNHLLRHLVYDDLGCFGDDLWTVWKVSTESYLTVLPNPHLDCNADMYCRDNVENIFRPHQEELLRLYYTYVHPSYPVLDPAQVFREKLRQRLVPSTLLAVVYVHAVHFWKFSPLATSHDCPLDREIRPQIFSLLTIEMRTPNLAVVQTVLLFMQLMPDRIRAPNHPGFWPMTNMLVGVAQDIGLHIDPTSWNITPAEKKMRRILWWAVYSHDAWMSHSLGRPSHIGFQDWNVTPLTLQDFADEDGRLNLETISWGTTFIALTSLSHILAEISTTCHSVRSNFSQLPAVEALTQGGRLLVKLDHWMETYALPTDQLSPFQYTLKVAAFSLRLSIQRALFSNLDGQQNPSALAQAQSILSLVRDSLLPILESMQISKPVGMWLSYLKGILSMIGSSLITLVLHSVDDKMMDERRGLLLQFRDYLRGFVDLYSEGLCFEFARLPLRRLNLIVEELFKDNAVDDDSVLGNLEVDDAFWFNYDYDRSM